MLRVLLKFSLLLPALSLIGLFNELQPHGSCLRSKGKLRKILKGRKGFPFWFCMQLPLSHIPSYYVFNWSYRSQEHSNMTQNKSLPFSFLRWEIILWSFTGITSVNQLVKLRNLLQQFKDYNSGHLGMLKVVLQLIP